MKQGLLNVKVMGEAANHCQEEKFFPGVFQDKEDKSRKSGRLPDIMRVIEETRHNY